MPCAPWFRCRAMKADAFYRRGLSLTPPEAGSGRGSRRRGAAAGSRALALVLLLACTPTLGFLGHWHEILGGETVSTGPSQFATLSDTAAAAEERAEHARHCHEDVASCAAQPLPSGLGLLITQECTVVGPTLSVVRRPL